MSMTSRHLIGSHKSLVDIIDQGCQSQFGSRFGPHTCQVGRTSTITTCIPTDNKQSDFFSFVFMQKSTLADQFWSTGHMFDTPFYF